MTDRWDKLHDALRTLEPGEWTTYGDLARLVGTAAIAIGHHLGHCDDCVHAARVLGADGRSRDGFAWTDTAEARTQRQVLEAEGVPFGADGRADRDALVSADELRARLADR